MIVSTSIGEEGLDIGEVDIIVCYDSQKAAIRMVSNDSSGFEQFLTRNQVQRVGRTGRKKDGKVEVLLTKGREEGNWTSAMSSYKDVQQSIVRGTDLELYGDVKRLLPNDIEPKCVEMVMEIIPYEREEPKQRSLSGPKSKQTALKFDGGKAKAKIKRARESDEEEEELEESPSRKKQRKFVDSDSNDSDGPKPKKRTNAKRTESRSKVIAKPVANPPAIPTAGFVSARDVARNLKDSDDEDLDPEKIIAKARTKEQLSKPSKGKLAPKKSTASKASASTSTVSKPSKGPSSMAWLIGSDSEPETKPPVVKKKGNSPVLDLSDIESNSDIEVIEVVQSPPRKSAVQPVTVTPLRGLPSSSPDSSFPILPARRRVGGPGTTTILESPQDTSSPVLQRIRRGDGDTDRVLMPPPPLLAATGRSNVGQSGPTTNHRQRNSERPTKRSILDRNEFLEVEAVHSGDEVEAGSSDSEGEANSSDREFVTDASGTQAPSDYDQSAIYRQGLFTQAPMRDAPKFGGGPVRTGFLGRGHIAANLRQEAASSSPVKDDELDSYSYGSFVVEDDDDILLEGSSEG